jgi:hypothetical protein
MGGRGLWHSDSADFANILHALSWRGGEASGRCRFAASAFHVGENGGRFSGGGAGSTRAQRVGAGAS